MLPRYKSVYQVIICALYVPLMYVYVCLIYCVLYIKYDLEQNVHSVLYKYGSHTLFLWPYYLFYAFMLLNCWMLHVSHVFVQ